MRFVGGMLWSGLALAALIGVAGIFGGRGAGGPLEAGEPKTQKAAPLPALKVDKGAPLLLDSLPDAKPEKTPDEGPVADNSACYCCHRNYEEEPMAQVARQGQRRLREVPWGVDRPPQRRGQHHPAGRDLRQRADRECLREVPRFARRRPRR